LRAEEWQSSTSCRIEIVPQAGGSMPVLSHAGWENIDRATRQMAQRRRFGEHWLSTDAASAEAAPALSLTTGRTPPVSFSDLARTAGPPGQIG
jgi:hypothetical protein